MDVPDIDYNCVYPLIQAFAMPLWFVDQIETTVYVQRVDFYDFLNDNVMFALDIEGAPGKTNICVTVCNG